MGIFPFEIGKNNFIFWTKREKSTNYVFRSCFKSQTIHERCIINSKIIYQKKEVAVC